MAWWIYDTQTGQGTLDYPTLGFRAEVGDILSASAAPDAHWSTTGAGPETVERYTIGSDPSYVEPTDGHVLAWSDTANAYTPKTTSSILAVTRDESVTEWPFTVGSFAAVIPGMMVTIPPVSRPVLLDYQAYGRITVAGVGIFGYTIYETTSGTGVDVGGNSISLIENAGTFEALRSFRGSTIIQPLTVPTWRSFRLYGGIFRASGSATAVSSSSGATNNRSTHLMAVQL